MRRPSSLSPASTQVLKRAQVAARSVLRKVAFVRESQQRRWLQSLAAREYNYYTGDFRVRWQGGEASSSIS
jgi:hypothetical protein